MTSQSKYAAHHIPAKTARPAKERSAWWRAYRVKRKVMGIPQNKPRSELTPEQLARRRAHDKQYRKPYTREEQRIRNSKARQRRTSLHEGYARMLLAKTYGSFHKFLEADRRGDTATSTRITQRTEMLRTFYAPLFWLNHSSTFRNLMGWYTDHWPMEFP